MDTATATYDTSIDATIARIRKSLRARSGKAWSVKRGSGTAYSWITICAPPARLADFGAMTAEDAAELGRLLGLDQPAHHQGEMVAASSDHRIEYIDRAEGRTPSRIGQAYWD